MGKSGTRSIAFDTWCLGAQARNQGVHVYARMLLEHFRDLAPEQELEIVPYQCSALDNDANRLRSSPGLCPRQTALLRFSRLWRFGGGCVLARRQKMDLIFSPLCTSLYAGKKVPAVVTIHDVIPNLLAAAPKRINETLRFCGWWAARFSKAVITVSQHSKNDLLNLYKIPESKVVVVYNGCDQRIFNKMLPNSEQLRSLLDRLGIAGPYVLHHGTIKPNKNLIRLVQAYDRMTERNRNLAVTLVLAGSLGWGAQELVAMADCRPRVVVTGPLPEPELGILVKGAQLAVFPSLYEGFCLPMIEAMACGVPTVASASSCLPEISGGVLRYFDPVSVDQMSNCMEEALEDSRLRTELSEKGRARASEFDWRRCAEETLKILKNQLASDL